jgi:hypothetical protein
MSGLDPTWIEYFAAMLCTVACGVAVFYGLFGLTAHSLLVVLVREGLFMALIIMIDHFYGDALPE